ncbi:MAG: alpha/beta hydrolase [Burkholderiales bacterium]
MKIVLVVCLAYVAILGVLYVFQDRLIYYPQVGRSVRTTPAARGIAYDEVALRTDDGETLNAWWIPTPESRGVALLLPGNAGNISHRIDYAIMFRGLRFSTLLVDYRGYGKSTGKPSEEGTYSDADTAWRWLTETHRIPGRDIVVYGESLGGGVSSWLASRYRPRALVLASTFTSALDLGAELYWFLPVRMISRFRYDTLTRLATVQAPVLVIHSRADEIVPYAHGERLYAAANAPKAFLEISGGHNDSAVFMRSEWVEALGAFLDRADDGRQPQAVSR